MYSRKRSRQLYETVGAKSRKTIIEDTENNTCAENLSYSGNTSYHVEPINVIEEYLTEHNIVTDKCELGEESFINSLNEEIFEEKSDIYAEEKK
jgi:hypothetical protein